jgi:GT2 family glycosyltransferase
MDGKPFVSIVVPTYNRVSCLVDALNSIAALQYSEKEILVIDQSSESSEEKEKYFQKNKNIIRIKDTLPNRCRAKSMGISHSKGDFIFICDDDVLVPPDLVEKHLTLYQDTSIGAVSTRVYEKGQAADLLTKKVLQFTFYGRMYNNSNSRASTYTDYLNGGSMSLRRSVIEKIGLFDERYIGTGMMEEPDISFRIRKAGYKIYFDGGTTVLHFPQKNGNVLSRQNTRVQWYHDYFYNFTLYHRKYKLFFKLLLSFPWISILALRQGWMNRLTAREIVFMLKGYFLKG